MSDAPKPKNSKKTPPKVIDIAHPGTKLPNSSARPIIVSNRPILKDPMVVDGASTAPELPTSPTRTSTKVKIQPLSDEPAEAAPSTDTAPEVAPQTAAAGEAPVDKGLTIESAIAKAEQKKAKDEPKKAAAEAKPEEPVAEPEAKPEEEPAKPKVEPPEGKKAADVLAPEPEAADKTVPKPPREAYKAPDSSVDDTTPADEDKPEDKEKADTEAAVKAAEAEAKRQAELNKMVESKQYFLPINSVERRRSTHVAIFGLILIIILALVWLDLAADAGFVQLPVKPLTHFFHN